MAKDSCREHLADVEHTLLPVVVYNGHCLLPVLGDTRLAVCKDSKKMVSNRVQVENGGVLLLTGGNLVRLDVIVNGGDIQSSAVGDDKKRLNTSGAAFIYQHLADGEHYQPPTVVVNGLVCYLQ